MLQHSLGILTKPGTEWRRLADLTETQRAIMLLYPMIWAVLPAVAWYWGTTHVGWSVGNDGGTIRLTDNSATLISFLFYAGMVTCVAVIGYFVHWMSETYGADSSITKGILIVSICATPLFIAGAVGFYPILWLDMILGVFALSWSTYLLYTGIPVIMRIPETRGFLFASAVVGIAFIIFICLLVATVMLWEWGATPSFTD